jgi:hypothetical protein
MNRRHFLSTSAGTLAGTGLSPFAIGKPGKSL